MLCFAILGVLGTSATARADKNGDCERETIATLTSPDNAWVALAEEHVCGGEGPATTSLSDTVQLVRHGEKAADDNFVFAIEEHGNPSNRPVMQWLDPRKLQITVSNRAVPVANQIRAYW
jgi:hypothetical protein